jgi:hypothetical protein
MSTSIASKPTFIPAAERFGVGQRVPYDPDRHRILTAHDDMSTPHLMVLERVVGTPDADAAIQLSEERVLTARDLPAVEMMATLVHAGRLSDIHRSYGLLGT